MAGRKHRRGPWLDEDLKAAVVATIKNLKKDGVVIAKDMKELMPDPGAFRKGRGLKVVRTVMAEVPASSPGDDTVRDGAEGGGQLVNSGAID